MNFEPQKFFIGLMDFFSILLPGALLSFFLRDDLDATVLGKSLALEGTQGWAAFLFASYLLGHLIFLLGSWLDDFYDWARRYTLNTQIQMLARRGKLLPTFIRAMIWLVFKGERNLAVSLAGKIKNAVLGPLRAGAAINTFQWSKVFLSTENPEGLAAVQRFEADSKFFRSFVIVMLVLLVKLPCQSQWPLKEATAFIIFLLILSLWRYMEQRLKATNQAYWSVIALASQGGKITLPPWVPKGPTHAGGVVFRERSGEKQFLLVETKNDPNLWVLPKGHVEEGENEREAAVREMREETGIWARIVRDLKTVSYKLNGADVTVQFYVMEWAGRGVRDDKFRKHVWLPLPDAIKRASHDETGQLLRDAEEALRLPSASGSGAAKPSEKQDATSQPTP